MGKWNIGLIGAGSISEAHLDAYRADPRAALAAVCDLNRDRAAAKARKYGAAAVYTDYAELLADERIDAVSVCTWNESHARIAEAALRAGKHVLLEKPLSRTVEEALRLQEAVRETGRTLQVGFVRRYDPNARMLYRFVESGELGDIYYAKASTLRRIGNPGGWFADIGRSGGGPLIDIGVHVLDLCWYFMGRPKVKSVSGQTYRMLGNRSNVQNLSYYRAADYEASQNSVEDLAAAFIRFDNGASLMLDVSYSLHLREDERKVQLFGTRGGIEIDPEVCLVQERHDTVLNVRPQVDHPGFDFGRAFGAEIAHFLDCLDQGTRPISPVEDGVEVMRMLRGLYESAEKGEEIRF
ncbi:Gfo/Idh/MocA family protein [Gorillibacterium sp. sgz500922]|uniref:Gfo/Idh/MocA family protein n=1 Tax=Gorillibacterium sp. sgz500922 TaxID=3446694 RepID=UPI003F669DA7